MFADNEAVSVNGTFLQVPDIANTEVKLCVSFQSSSSSDRIIVLVHHRGDPKKLSAYFMNTSNCTTAPTPGVYVVGVLTQSHDSTLKIPATPPTISVGTVPISEYYYKIFKAVILLIKRVLLSWVASYPAPKKRRRKASVNLPAERSHDRRYYS